MGLKNVKNEGSIVFWLNHEHKDWPTNSSGYNFDTVQNEDISAEVTKHPDKTVEIKLTGPFDKTFVFRRSDYRGISHWRQKRVTKRTQSQEKKVAIAKMEL